MLLSLLCQLHSIPTLGGPAAPILSYLTALNFSKNGRALLSEGYERVSNGNERRYE